MRKSYQASTFLTIAVYRHGSNERNCAYSNNSRHPNGTPKRTPVTNTYIKMYEHVMLSDIASSLPQRPLRNATKQLRSLEQRATPQIQETFSHLQHTGPIRYQVTVVIVTVYHRIVRRINCVFSNDNEMRLPQFLLWPLHIPQYIRVEAVECRVVIVTAPTAKRD